ncbi:MAG TPA: hypothetical protein VEZ44_04450 [bacterium]|nr:hypothetical protein [bacterium]
MQMRFALFDLSGGATTADGAALTAAILAQIAHACEVQLNLHFSAEYGGNFTVRPASGAGDLQTGEYPFAILATLADAPGAIAYHSTDGNGMPLLFDGITLSDSLIGPGNSLAVAVSHELLETARDEGTNDWLDDGQGYSVAAEVCDPVESNSYPLEGCFVSDFVLKSWTVPGRQGPYNAMGQLGLGGVGPPAPFALAPGGYLIRRTQGQGEAQVTASYASLATGLVLASTPHPGTRAHRRAERRAHEASRASKRGLRAA